MWRRRTDDDFEREIEAHLAIETERLIAEGLSPEDARHAAARAFGNVAKTQEQYYESRRVLWFDDLRQDARYAFRALRRSPGFAGVAILTLALGIGSNTAIFSVINAVLLRPLPYSDPGSLVLIQPGEIGLSPGWVVPAWRDRARALAGLAGFNGPRTATLINRGAPEPVRATDVTWNFLSFLGVTPALGRDFTEADAAPGASGVAILADDLWRRQFEGNPDVIGRSVTVSGIPLTIVGVAPPSFRFPTAGALPAFGLPFETQPDLMRIVAVRARAAGERDAVRSVNVIGRLEPGATPASASEELLAIYRQEGASEFSKSLLDRTQIAVSPLQERLVGNLPQRLWLVMGAVTFVLLVACANVANLLLARASSRQREIALRAALGARRGRLARLLLTESVVLALLGSAGALLLAYSTGGVARTLLADRIPHIASVSIDWTVMAFNIALATATGVLCGCASLPGSGRVNFAAIFSGAATGSVTGRSLMRRALLSTEAGVTFVLVVGAALFAQTLWNLSVQDNGFDANRTLTLRVAPGLPPEVDTRTDRKAGSKYFAAFFADLRTRLEGIPGVASAGAINLAPLAGTSAGLVNVSVEGRQAPAADTFTPVAFVTPGYFGTMRIPVIAGRDFNESDRLGAERVAIVNEAFQRRYAPDGPILGLRIGDLDGKGGEVLTVVGVTRDVPDRSLRQAPEPLIVEPLAQMPASMIGWGSLTFVLRTDGGDPRRLAPAVRREIWAINPNIVIDEVATMDERVAAGMRTERDSALLFGLFALAALVMAAIGIYGVAAYALAQRTKEIGIRVALGAAKQDVSRLVVSQTLWPTLVGVAIGLGTAVLLSRLVASMVYGVMPLDPATFAVAVLVLVSVALAATWAPARRATQIDPLVALRYE
jgi:putative ABC transport system permease protein